MKKFFINKSLKLIKKNNNNLSDIKLEEIEYGLESLYLTYTKFIVLTGLAIILGIFKEYVILLVAYNVIRTFSFGLHATKSIYCLLSSLICFIGGVYVCEYLYIPLTIKILVSIFCVYCLIRYAPADTEKRPLINKKKREMYKVISVLLGCCYLVLICIFNKHIVSNYLLVGMVEAVIMIHPLIYKMFNLPFDNYKNYNFGHN